MEQGKICSKCRDWKVFDEFSKRKEGKDGYRNQCKECRKKHQQKYYLDNKETIDRKQKNYEFNNKEIKKQRMAIYYKINKFKINQRNSNYKENNEQYKLNQKQYRLKNADKIAENGKRWSKKHPDKVYLHQLKRRSNKFHVHFSPFKRLELLNRDNYTCKCCGIKVHDRHTGDWNTPDKAHIDHIVPLSKGGNSEPNNLQVLCRTCNLSKSDSLEYIEQVN